MNKTALITGGSKGLGFELASQFAQDGYDLVLVARNEDELALKAKILTDRYSIHTEIIQADLSEISSIEFISETLKTRNIFPDVLVNNAGFGLHGFFPSLDLKKQIDMINVNISAIVGLTRILLPGMIKRKSGGILNIASTAAFYPGPMMSVYYASKTFVLYFSEALREEVHACGISVSTLCPGPTETNFEKRSGMGNTLLVKRKFISMMSAQKVASIGFKGFKAKIRVIIPGVRNKIGTILARFIPRSITSKIIRLLNTPV
jgi:short-subunit dehydrogenase